MAPANVEETSLSDGRPRRRRFRRLLRLAALAVIIAVLLLWTSCTMFNMPGKSHTGPLPPLTEDETVLAGELRVHVTELAGTIGARNLGYPDALEEAALYIERQLAKHGYDVGRQEFEVEGRPCRNIEAELPGASLAEEIVVIGAHYDTCLFSPGANDNGSGVAALLELAGRFAGEEYARTVRWVAFVNEEPPYFQTNDMGSLVYARRSGERGEKVVAMLALETIGAYYDEEGSQRYPFPFSLFYPSTGNFIGFVGNTGSSKLVKRVVGSFREHARFPSEGAAVFGWITGVDWSDHWSFWQEGYPALMVTDTAPFRYPYYHTAEDTPEKLRYDRLARVTAGLEKVIADLANR